MYTFTVSIPEPKHKEGERVLLKDVSGPEEYNLLRERDGQTARITYVTFTGVFIIGEGGGFIGPPVNGEWVYWLSFDDETHFEYGEYRNSWTELITVEELAK